MKEFETLKNLLLDVLANQGGTYHKQAINAINAIKFDQEITVPIIINQSISVLNVTIQQRIVNAIKRIDRQLVAVEREATREGKKAVKKLVDSEPICTGELLAPKVKVPIDYKSAVEHYKTALIEKALEMTKGNITNAAILLRMNRTTLQNQIARSKS